ncbi:MAG: hypothetical protein ACRECC_02300 [Pseudolabrys sp.]|jgi:hypothetical protein
MTKYLIAVALAALVATPALAASRNHAYRDQASAAYASDPSGYAFGAPIANTVVRNGEILGSDPDPTIRMDLLRQGDQLNTNGN